MRRRQRSRWKKIGEVLTAPEIMVIYGPGFDVAYVRSVSPLTGMVTLLNTKKDADPLLSIPVTVMLESVIPATADDAEAMFDLLEVELGEDFYDELNFSTDDLMECVKLYGRNPDSSYFKSQCKALTGKSVLDDMTTDERALVNSVLVTKLEGSGFTRGQDTEQFEDRGDKYEEDPSDDAYYYGEVDLTKEERELQARLVHRVRAAGDIILYDQEGTKKEITDPDGLKSDPSSPSHWQRTPDRERNAPAQDDLPGDDASQGADPSSSRVTPGGEGQFVYMDGYRAARSEWESLDDATHTAMEVDAKSFNVPVGGAIWYGKYKNKRGIVKGFKTNEKGDVIVVVEQIPNESGLKKPKELKLFKIRPRKEEPKEDEDKPEAKTANVRTAATIADLVTRTGPHIHERAGELGGTAAVKLIRANPAKGVWLFNVSGKTSTYRVRVKGVRKGNLKKLSKAQVRVSCSCPFWRWQGPEHWGKVNAFLYGRPRGTASKPVVMDPPGQHWACKHLLAALKLARNYHFASAEHSEWLQGDTEVLFDQPPIEDIYESTTFVTASAPDTPLVRLSPGAVTRDIMAKIGEVASEYRPVLGRIKSGIKARKTANPGIVTLFYDLHDKDRDTSLPYMEDLTGRWTAVLDALVAAGYTLVGDPLGDQEWDPKKARVRALQTVAVGVAKPMAGEAAAAVPPVLAELLKSRSRFDLSSPSGKRDYMRHVEKALEGVSVRKLKQFGNYVGASRIRGYMPAAASDLAIALVRYRG
jgi:hypothetical protein